MVIVLRSTSISGFPIRLGRRTGRVCAELGGVLLVEPRPLELHRVASDDTADWSSTEQAIEHIETDVPPGRTHRDVTAIDVVPERQPRAAAHGFQFPPHLVPAPVVL